MRRRLREIAPPGQLHRPALIFVLKVFVMRLSLIALMLLVAMQVVEVNSAAQNAVSKEGIASLVSELSWDSVGGECNGVWRIYPDGTSAKKLIQIGKPATAELLKVLSDENRGVAAHLILTAIWEPRNVRHGSWVEGNAAERAQFVHVYNGLKWVDVIDFKPVAVSYKVERIELVKNSKAWQSKLRNHQSH